MRPFGALAVRGFGVAAAVVAAVVAAVAVVAPLAACAPQEEPPPPPPPEDEEPAGSDIGVDKFSIDFGVVTVADVQPASVTIRNDGDRDLIVDTVAIIDVTPENTAPFVVPAFAAGVAVAPGDHAIVEVRFSPASAAAYTGALRITSNDVVTPAIDVALFGVGAAP